MNDAVLYNGMDHAYLNNVTTCPSHHRHGPLRESVKSVKEDEKKNKIKISLVHKCILNKAFSMLLTAERI
jgi:hypothetical protein